MSELELDSAIEELLGILEEEEETATLELLARLLELGVAIDELLLLELLALLLELDAAIEELLWLELLALLLELDAAMDELLGTVPPVFMPTNVVTLCAGRLAVKLSFERLMSAIATMFSVPELLLPVTFAIVPLMLLMLNCWLTADVFLLIATITTLSALLYADTKTFVSGCLVASTLKYPWRTNFEK